MAARKRLLKADKLRLKAEFDQVRAEGVKQAGRYLLAVVAPAPDGLRRCGVVCGRKFSTLAVRRNRARRLLWESFRLLKPEIAVCRLVLIPRRAIGRVKRPEVTQELAVLLHRGGVLPESVAGSPPAG